MRAILFKLITIDLNLGKLKKIQKSVPKPLIEKLGIEGTPKNRNPKYLVFETLLKIEYLIPFGSVSPDKFQIPNFRWTNLSNMYRKVALQI